MDKFVNLPFKKKDHELEREFEGKTTMEIIKNYVEMKPRLDAATELILNKQKDIGQIINNYRLKYTILHYRISIIKMMEESLQIKFRYEIAVNAFLSLDNEIYIKNIAKEYDISSESLREEIGKFKRSGETEYEYNKPLDSFCQIFTFKQELLLLKCLVVWKAKIPFCTCILCTMEKLLDIAYQFAREKKIKYPQKWEFENRANAGWLINFDMAYSNVISNLASRNQCFRVEAQNKPFCICRINILRKKEQMKAQKLKILSEYYYNNIKFA